MLEFKHLKCEVVDGATGAPLREWGKRSNLSGGDGGGGGADCFVQAAISRPFKIRITRSIPYPPVAGIVEAGRRRDAKNMKYGIPAKKDHAPYHLLGTLRFDGREKVESQCFVHLDDEHEYFRETVLMKGCQVCDSLLSRFHSRC